VIRLGARGRLRCASALLALALIIGVALSYGVTPVGSQESRSAQLLVLINQARLYEGLTPLGHSTLLAQAAQRHVDDLVTMSALTHVGSDGSTFQQRIREARYQAWNDGLLVDEVLWTGLGSAEDALVWFYTSPEWSTLADSRHREIGIGYADDAGVRYYVVTLGARPGVLPVFLNDGAEFTDVPQVALRLTNEDAVPLGDAGWIGRAIEVRLSNTPEFETLPWQPWEALLPWQLAGDQPGDYAVYVQFRDGAGRTAVSEDTVRLVSPGEAPTLRPLPNLPQRPTSPAEFPIIPEEIDSPSMPAPLPTVVTTPASQETQSGETVTPFPTWTPLSDDLVEVPEENSVDWPLLLAFLLQACAVILGALAFLRRS
jgi:uncharacterized protein YkwD